MQLPKDRQRRAVLTNWPPISLFFCFRQLIRFCFEWIYLDNSCEYDTLRWPIDSMHFLYIIQKLHKVCKCVYALLPLNGRKYKERTYA